jgi:hypothetical protein
MTGAPGDELLLAAERAVAKVHEALVHHAGVMSTPGVGYSEVAHADDRVIDALNAYRESAERITGLSVLLRVPTTDATPEEYTDATPEEYEISNGTEDESHPPAEAVVLEARWYFDVTDPRLVVAAASEELLAVGRRAKHVDVGGPERGEVDTGDFSNALAALFDRDVPWPPPEYTEIGIDVTGLDVAVYAQESASE